MKLREVGEDKLLDQLLPRLPLGKTVVAGAGDDCAVIEIFAGRNFLVLKTDCIVEGVHFLSGADPVDVGWKAMMRPLSDFAATSALPQFALITLIASKQTEVEWVRKLYRGLRRAAKQFDVSIVGGETSSSSGPIVISVSVAGFVERDRWMSRRGGKVGDDLFVTGQLGGAIKQKHLRFIPRIAESRWLTKHFSIQAMMDLSDGLGDRSSTSRPCQQSRIQNRDGEFAACPRSKDRRRHFGRRRLRIALCHFSAPEQTIAARLEEKVPETGPHPNRTATSNIKHQTSNIARWLRSFPTAQLKPRQLGGNSL